MIRKPTNICWIFCSFFLISGVDFDFIHGLILVCCDYVVDWILFQSLQMVLYTQNNVFSGVINSGPFVPALLTLCETA